MSPFLIARVTSATNNSQRKLQMKRGALQKLNRKASEEDSSEEF
jgi:hypothetical protein